MCQKVFKKFIAHLKALLLLTPCQSARGSSTDGLDSANFEKSLEQLNKLEEKVFQMFDSAC